MSFYDRTLSLSRTKLASGSSSAASNNNRFASVVEIFNAKPRKYRMEQTNQNNTTIREIAITIIVL
jgi:hypothetical protein